MISLILNSCFCSGGGQAEDHVGSGRHRALASDRQTILIDATRHRDRQLRGHNISGRIRQGKITINFILYFQSLMRNRNAKHLKTIIG